MNRRRVVVTGLGMISPLGIGTMPRGRGSSRGVRASARSRSSTRRVSRPDRRRGQRLRPRELDREKRDQEVGYVHPLRDRRRRRWPSTTRSSITRTCDSDRFGVIIGSGIGGLPLIEEMHAKLLERGPSRISPFFIPGLIVNLGAGQVSIRYGCQGSELGAGHGVRHGRARHRRGVPHHPARRSRHHVRRRQRSGASRRSAVGGFAAMRALSTRNDEPERASRPLDLESRRLRDGRRRGRAGARGAASTR